MRILLRTLMNELNDYDVQYHKTLLYFAKTLNLQVNIKNTK